jgi:hypothetical protein
LNFPESSSLAGCSFLSCRAPQFCSGRHWHRGTRLLPLSSIGALAWPLHASLCPASFDLPSGATSEAMMWCGANLSTSKAGPGLYILIGPRARCSSACLAEGMQSLLIPHPIFPRSAHVLLGRVHPVWCLRFVKSSTPRPSRKRADVGIPRCLEGEETGRPFQTRIFHLQQARKSLSRKGALLVAKAACRCLCVRRPPWSPLACNRSFKTSFTTHRVVQNHV